MPLVIPELQETEKKYKYIEETHLWFFTTHSINHVGHDFFYTLHRFRPVHLLLHGHFEVVEVLLAVGLADFFRALLPVPVNISFKDANLSDGRSEERNRKLSLHSCLSDELHIYTI